MKCYGYSKEDNDDLLEMSEVTLQADSKLLRNMANFLSSCADRIETDSEWEHEHFTDSKYCDSKDNLDSFDLIVKKST